MGALREYLGVLLGICLIAVPGLLLPQRLRLGLDRGLREVLVMPGQVVTSWVLLRWAAPRPVAPPAGEPDAAAHQQLLDRRWQAMLPRRDSRGAAATPLYQHAWDLALRDRFVFLNRFCRAPVLSRRVDLFRDGLRLGCGRRDQVAGGAPVFNAEGYLVGLVDEVMPLTSTMRALGSGPLALYCDIPGRDGLQGVLVGAWRRRSAGGPAALPGSLELQISSRGIAVTVGDAVVTSSVAATGQQALVPGGIPIGWVDAVETTEEGYVRARVKVPATAGRRQLYVATRWPSPSGPSVTLERAPDAAKARVMAELRRVLTVERDLFPGAQRQLAGVLAAGRQGGRQADAMARVAFAIRHRDLPTYYDHAEPAGAASLGLRAGLACLCQGALAGVVVREDERLRLRLLTSPELAIRVEVLQPDGRRFRGLLARADGPQAIEPVPEGWALPGQPRLQVLGLDNAGLPVQLPAAVVTAAGGAIALPEGIPIGTLIGARDDVFAPAWEVQPRVDFGALTYGEALVPTVTLPVSPPAALAPPGAGAALPASRSMQ